MPFIAGKMACSNVEGSNIASRSGGEGALAELGLKEPGGQKAVPSVWASIVIAKAKCDAIIIARDSVRC